jgi:hypothetical protein
MNTPPHSGNNQSPPASPGNPEFVQFLQGLCHHDNNIRQQAEQHYNNLKKSQPALLVTNLLAQLRGSSDRDLREFSAVLLRGLIGLRDTENVYTNLDANVQNNLRTILLQIALETANQTTLSKKVCDTIGELAIVIQVTSHWQELLPWIFQCIQTTNPNVCEVGLRTLSMVSMLFSDKPEYQQQFPLLSTLFQRMLTAQGAGIGIRHTCIAAICNLIVCLPKAEMRVMFRPLVPFMLQALAEVLSNDQTLLKSANCLELFCEVAYEHGSFFRTALKQVHGAMVQIAGTVQLDDSLRRLAVEWLCSCAESGGSMCRKLPNDAYTREALPVLMTMMFNDVNDIMGNLNEWEGKADGSVSTSLDGDDDIRNFDVACEAIKRLSASIGPKKFLPVFFELLGPHFNSNDWRHQIVGLVALGPVVEVAESKLMKPIMDQIVPFFNTNGKGQDPRVRCVACDVIGELSLETSHGPMFQMEYYETVIPILQNCLNDQQSARVQARGAAAFITFLECCDDAYVAPYLDGLLQVLFERLQKGKRTVQEQAVTALASVAECAARSYESNEYDDEEDAQKKEQLKQNSPLIKYYPAIMPVLKQILVNCDKKDERLFRARALECATLFGDAMPKAAYLADAQQLMQFMYAQQQAGLDFDHPLRSYMLQAYTRIGRCLGKDFAKYLHMIMPSLLEAAAVEAEVTTIQADDNGEDDLSETAEKYKVNLGEGRVITVHTSALDEKTTAMQMLGSMAKEMKGLFAPYVQSVFSLAAPLMLFSGTCHDDLRACAIACIPPLIDSINVTGDKNMVKQLFNAAMAQLLTAQLQEAEMDVVKTIAQSIKETILAACRPAGVTKETTDFSNSVPMLDAQSLQQTFKQLVIAMRSSLQRRQTRKAERQVAEDYDEDDAEMDELCNESEVELLYFLHEAIGAVIRTHGNTFLPAFVAEVLPLMQQMGQKNSIETDQKIVVYIYDDVVEFGGNMVQSQLLPQILPSFMINATPDADCGLRQGAVYGLGVAAAVGGNYFTPYLNQTVEVLMNCITDPHAYEGNSGAATDNAISALGKLCDAHFESFPSASQIIDTHWLQRLPLRVDEEESITVSNHLCSMLENQQRNMLVLGTNFKNLAKVITILMSVLTSKKSDGLWNKDLKERIQKILGALKQGIPQPALQDALTRVPPNFAQAFA